MRLLLFHTWERTVENTAQERAKELDDFMRTTQILCLVFCACVWSDYNSDGHLIWDRLGSGPQAVFTCLLNPYYLHSVKHCVGRGWGEGGGGGGQYRTASRPYRKPTPDDCEFLKGCEDMSMTLMIHIISVIRKNFIQDIRYFDILISSFTNTGNRCHICEIDA